ncbi:MAG: alpha/beta hydrolase [Acidobacteriota bacterium]|nr:alpha/beta hydrolase [Acidobacteriota bacterium]
MSNFLDLPMDPAFLSLVKQPREVLRDAKVVREAASAARLRTKPALSELDLQIQDYVVSASDREMTQVSVRIYRKKSAVGALPALLYLHGGGFFSGDLFSDEAQCIHYALNTECAVVCVAYRLAPEHPFPAALTDCYRVLQFLWRERQTLNLDRDFIAVGGSSAGANLAAAVSLMARDQMGPKICFQMLLVPALDDRLETMSALQFTDVPDFARPEAEVMWRWYLGENSDEVSPYAAPARAKDLSGLPTTYVLCAGLDPLRDEGLNYAHRLTEAGVAVELHLVPSIPHGFASIPSAVISKRLLNEQVEVLRGAFRSRLSSL